VIESVDSIYLYKLLLLENSKAAFNRAFVDVASKFIKSCCYNKRVTSFDIFLKALETK
jgi:hypothetical protein